MNDHETRMNEAAIWFNGVLAADPDMSEHHARLDIILKFANGVRRVTTIAQGSEHIANIQDSRALKGTPLMVKCHQADENSEAEAIIDLLAFHPSETV